MEDRKTFPEKTVSERPITRVYNKSNTVIELTQSICISCFSSSLNFNLVAKLLFVLRNPFCAEEGTSCPKDFTTV